jgi:hypothetical protein
MLSIKPEFPENKLGDSHILLQGVNEFLFAFSEFFFTDLGKNRCRRSARNATGRY